MKPLMFNERIPLFVHVNEVSKLVKEQGGVQSLVESFIVQAT
jgi:hypothetical protein